MHGSRGPLIGLLVTRLSPARIVVPSILAADYGCFANEARRVEVSGGDWLHVDIMDGHFVDNISFGPGVLKAIRQATKLYLDVHLMISRPDHYWPRFAEAGADGITVHLEAQHDVITTLQAIRSNGQKVGLAINPATPFESTIPFLEQIDLLLIMTVVPGFGGQAFLRETLPKVAAASEYRKGHGLSFHIEVDGGIDSSTARDACEAGANVLVAGTSVMQATDMAQAIVKLRNL